MKKTYLLLIVSFTIFINNTYSQFDTIPAGATLSEAIPLCDTQTDSVKYILSHDVNFGETGPNYGCLNSQPNPSWFYIKTTEYDTTPININIDVAQDVDFVVWGPFEEITYDYDSLQEDHIIDCEYGALNTTNINIDSVVLNSYYMVMITNYSNNVMLLQPNVYSGTLVCEYNLTSLMQEYISFPTENATWVNTHYSISSSGDYSLSGVVNYCMNDEDTLINEKQYTKVNYCEGEYKGAIRDKAGIVYFCAKDSSNEHILYDFTVDAGDTVFDVFIEQYPLSVVIIQSVDSILINDNYRKTIRLTNGAEWIEGIGCTQGLFMEPWYNVSFYDLILNCFSQNDTIYYPYFSVGSCSLTVGEKELETPQINIFPNPANSFVNIKLSNQPESTQSINIYSIDGRLKTSILNKEDQVRINTKTWNKGVYFIQIRTNEQSYIQKLLIE